MLLWIMVFVGTLIFVSGLYLLVKNYKNGKYIKGHGLVFNHIIILNNFMLQIKLQTLIIMITYPLFDLLPHRWQRYEKIN